MQATHFKTHQQAEKPFGSNLNTLIDLTNQSTAIVRSFLKYREHLHTKVHIISVLVFYHSQVVTRETSQSSL